MKKLLLFSGKFTKSGNGFWAYNPVGWHAAPVTNWSQNHIYRCKNTLPSLVWSLFCGLGVQKTKWYKNCTQVVKSAKVFWGTYIARYLSFQHNKTRFKLLFKIKSNLLFWQLKKLCIISDLSIWSSRLLSHKATMFHLNDV